MDIVERIRRVASEKNMTLTDVGRETGIGQTAIYRWNKTNPSLSNVQKVADLLNVSIDFLVYGNDTNKRSL